MVEITVSPEVEAKIRAGEPVRIVGKDGLTCAEVDVSKRPPRFFRYEEGTVSAADARKKLLEYADRPQDLPPVEILEMGPAA